MTRRRSPGAVPGPDRDESRALLDRLAAAGWRCAEVAHPGGPMLECARGVFAVLGRDDTRLERARDAARQADALGDRGPAPARG